MASPAAAEDRIFAEDDLDAVNALAMEQGWGDGLPIVPPTVDRVQKMMATVGRAPDELVALVLPKRGRATIEKIAANAVMAGCLPSYFPVVVAAVEAMTDPDFSLFRVNSTTNSVAVMVIVNGPIRHEIGINSGPGVFGPGWRANATIGRAVRLVQLNIGGSVPGAVSKSTQGQPGRYTMCVGENEERSPWEPLHVERGCQPGESAVTVFPPMSTINVSDVSHTDARTIIEHMTSLVDCSSTHTLKYSSGDILWMLNPDHARIMADAGMSKQDVKQALWEASSRIQLSRFVPDIQQKLIKEGRVTDGTIRLAPGPDYFMVMVAGGDGGLHATLLPAFAGCLAVTKKIR
ncbi:MAG: hypothetical protein HYX92_06205 [Chloroflexi bacterium]|nr:hypothetical protein [Chloroflexota bacterium]